MSDGTRQIPAGVVRSEAPNGAISFERMARMRPSPMPASCTPVTRTGEPEAFVKSAVSPTGSGIDSRTITRRAARRRSLTGTVASAARNEQPEHDAGAAQSQTVSEEAVQTSLRGLDE